jgi:hypothetical protein
MSDRIEDASYQRSRRFVYVTTLVVIAALLALPFLL